jgi:hypothetical protein
MRARFFYALFMLSAPDATGESFGAGLYQATCEKFEASW